MQSLLAKPRSNRALLWILAFGMITWLPSAGALAFGHVKTEGSNFHVVTPGESLWSIAAGTVDHDGDVGSAVDHIVAYNGLNQAVVYPGQRIRIPGTALSTNPSK